MVGLAALLEGAASFYLGDTEAAIKSYRNCLKRRYPSKDEYDQHVSAFALYELGSNLCNNNVSMLNIYICYLCRIFFYIIVNLFVFVIFTVTFIFVIFQNPNEGKNFLLKAQTQYRDYDFESRLNVRIHSALKNIQ